MRTTEFITKLLVNRKSLNLSDQKYKPPIGIIGWNSGNPKPVWFTAGSFLGGSFSYDSRLVRLNLGSYTTYYVPHDDFSPKRDDCDSVYIRPETDEIYADKQLFTCKIEKHMEKVPNKNFPPYVKELDKLLGWTPPKPV